MLLDELKSLHKDKRVVYDTRFHKKSYVEGETDYFVGIDLPSLRVLARKYYQDIDEQLVIDLLKNQIHEYRLLALIILSYQIKKTDINQQRKIVQIYLNHLNYVNNWDLVDVSAANIIGRYLYNIEDFNLLYELSLSTNLWYKRVAIVASHYLILNNNLEVTLDLVDNLIYDTHDLIHKACGWMLRELGKKNQEILTEYLEVNYQIMPRTMLRYAIEKYPEDIRKRILKGDFLWR